MGSQQRKEYIDVAKGVAITLVVMGHVLCYCFYDFHGESTLLSLIAFFHMPLFMFLSGLVVSSADKTVREIGGDCWKRVRALLVPFLVFGGTFAWIHCGNMSGLFCTKSLGCLGTHIWQSLGGCVILGRRANLGIYGYGREVR